MEESACKAEDPGSIPGSERSPGDGIGYPLPVFLPGEFRGQRSLAGHSPWGRKELDITEHLTLIMYFGHVTIYLSLGILLSDSVIETFATLI